METASTAAVLLLDLPQAALAGIDLLSFATTQRFKGVKNLPSGLHFVFTGSSTAFSVRHGRWFSIPHNHKASGPGPSLTISRWDAVSETLLTVTNEAEKLKWRANLGSIWREGLTPYRRSTSKDLVEETQEERDDWPQLTAYITDKLLSRLTGGKQDDWTLTSASSAIRDIDDIPGLSAEESKLRPEEELKFLPIDLKQTWREGATGRERTEAAQDRSWALNELIGTHCGGKDMMEIVGEMQFCFLMVLTLNNWSCLEQWKRILTLLFTCKLAVPTRLDLFVRAIATLRLQLQHCKDAEGGLIDLADEGGSLLKELLIRFRRGLEGFDGIAVGDVVDELDDLKAYLRDEHGWQFGGSFVRSGMLELEDGEQVRVDTTAYDEDDEAGEFAPQIVDLTPDQAKLLNITDAGDLHVSLSKASLHDMAKETVVSGSSESGSQLSEEESEMGDLDDMDARY